jgi:hypothetical protein
MFDQDLLIGLVAIFTPFVLVAMSIGRQHKSNRTNRHGIAATPLNVSGKPLRSTNPSSNVNGLPMVGAVDVNGNTFGSVSVHPTNVSGLPMHGGVDACGNPFGSTGNVY